jgi:hypothetical protein
VYCLSGFITLISQYQDLAFFSVRRTHIGNDRDKASDEQPDPPVLLVVVISEEGDLGEKDLGGSGEFNRG